MAGWLSEAADWASRRNRAWKVASLARSVRRRLIATVRPRRTSVPLRTSAMPPRPSSSPTSYRPPIRCRSVIAGSVSLRIRAGRGHRATLGGSTGRAAVRCGAARVAAATAAVAAVVRKDGLLRLRFLGLLRLRFLGLLRLLLLGLGLVALVGRRIAPDVEGDRRALLDPTGRTQVGDRACFVVPGVVDLVRVGLEPLVGQRGLDVPDGLADVGRRAYPHLVVRGCVVRGRARVGPRVGDEQGNEDDQRQGGCGV